MSRLSLLMGIVVASSSLAQPRWGLKWRAPDECIGPAELAQLVEEKLGRPGFGSNAQLRLEGGIQKGTGPAWKARMTAVSDVGEVIGTRELTSNEGDCRELDARIVSLVLLTIEPEVRPGPVSTAPLPADPQSLPVPEGSVFLHIDSPTSEVRLHRYLGTSTGVGYTSRGAVAVTTLHYSDECRAPCDRLIPEAEQRFFIGGDGVSPAGPFVLADHHQAGRVNMTVQPGSAAAAFWGWFSAGFFGLGGIAGGIAMMALSGPSPSYETYGVGRAPSTELFAGGVGVLITGLAAAVIGTVVAISNNTTVTFPDELPKKQ